MAVNYVTPRELALGHHKALGLTEDEAIALFSAMWLPFAHGRGFLRVSLRETLDDKRCWRAALENTSVERLQSLLEEWWPPEGHPPHARVRAAHELLNERLQDGAPRPEEP